MAKIYTAPLLQFKGSSNVSTIKSELKDFADKYEALYINIKKNIFSGLGLTKAKKEKLYLKQKLIPLIEEYKDNPTLWIQSNYESTAKEAVLA